MPKAKSLIVNQVLHLNLFLTIIFCRPVKQGQVAQCWGHGIHRWGQHGVAAVRDTSPKESVTCAVITTVALTDRTNNQNFWA